MNTANWWKRMALGLDIWNYKQHLLLHIVIFVFTGWDSHFCTALICVFVSILMDLVCLSFGHFSKLFFWCQQSYWRDSRLIVRSSHKKLVQWLVKLPQHYYKWYGLSTFSFKKYLWEVWSTLLSSGRFHNWYTDLIYLCTYAMLYKVNWIMDRHKSTCTKKI